MLSERAAPVLPFFVARTLDIAPRSDREVLVAWSLSSSPADLLARLEAIGAVR